MRRLWVAFVMVSVIGFGILGWVGSRIYQEAPPIPERVLTADGSVVVPDGDIGRGQNVWQTMGGMEVGSVWGHGSYVAPDWTADWLHREAVFILNDWAGAEAGRSYLELAPERQAALRERLTRMMRRNGYDPVMRALTIEPVRVRAFEANHRHYANIFANGHAPYAIPRGTVSDPERLRRLSAFFFWTAWAAATNRPSTDISYTSNWPHEPLIGNRPTGEAVVWTGVSVIVLLAGIGALVWWYAARPIAGPHGNVPAADPILAWRATPSQRATVKYFVVVAMLFLLQILTGAITAHYGVEGDGFYGIPLSRWLPYSLARTWHIQLAIFWIATAWLASGLFIGPLLLGKDPAGQRLFVNVLFAALLVVVAGSLTGEALAIHGKLSDTAAFYVGHQGYEYLDLGRFWQVGLYVGLLLWLALILRVTVPALRRATEEGPLLSVFLMSTVAIALLYGAGLFWGRHTHLSIVEYWRWWVVHLWVEGYFEIFATSVIGFFFARLRLVDARLAAEASLLAAVIYLAGGIVGTLHHLYFAGTPTVALAWGATVSALEVVPLMLVGYAATSDFRASRAAGWAQQYRWPIAFFIATAFWNMVGAGLFGFMINPPIALYYMQGLNTTPVHAHGALFGVYGMLGLGLMLMCLRTLQADREWKDGLVRFGFWAVNVGLMLQIVLSLLPVGLLQTWASVQTGYWYARSPEFLDGDVVRVLRWMRTLGDTLFAAGAIAVVVFVVGLRAGYSIRPPHTGLTQR